MVIVNVLLSESNNSGTCSVKTSLYGTRLSVTLVMSSFHWVWEYAHYFFYFFNCCNRVIVLIVGR